MSVGFAQKVITDRVKPFITEAAPEILQWVDKYRTGSGSDRVKHALETLENDRASW